MNKIVLRLCVGGAAALVAGAAIAQSDFAAQREADLRASIADRADSGDLTAGQADQLRSELRQIVRLDDRYADEGMTGWQERDLNSRLSLLESRLNYDVSINRGADDFGY